MVTDKGGRFMRIRKLSNFDSTCAVTHVKIRHLERRHNWQGRARFSPREDDLFLFLFSGSIDFTSDDGKGIIRLHAHDMAYIPRGSCYSSVYTADVTETCTILFRLSDDDGAFVLSDSMEVMDAQYAVRYESLFNDFRKSYPSANQVLHQTSMLYSFLTQLSLSGYDAYTDKHYALIAPGVELLIDRFQENIPVSELARASMVSECYFRRLFKQFFRQSPIAYRNMLRLRYASDLYESGLYSHAEAAAMAGIPNASYFCRLRRQFAPPVDIQPQIFGNDEEGSEGK